MDSIFLLIRIRRKRWLKKKTEQLQNRRNRTRKQMHPYDIVIGPIANEAVGFQIRRYVSGLIDLEKFLTELKYMGGITMQYFFGTEKALQYLKKIDVL